MTNEFDKSVTFTVSMPSSMKEELKKYTKGNDMSLSFAIQKACKSLLSKKFTPQTQTPINSIAQEFVPHKLPEIKKWSDAHNVDQQELAVDLINSLCRYIKRDEDNGQPRPLFEPKPEEDFEPLEVNESMIDKLKEVGFLPPDMTLEGLKAVGKPKKKRSPKK